MQLTGAQILIECLKEQGVDTVFGYPGGSVLNIYDELYKHQHEIRHILTAHEQGAAHAADGYARATGKVGVCIATSGPGATNLVTGIATAYMDSVPMVAITGNVPVSLLGKDSFQEVDICGITMPITKHNFIVKDVKDLADIIRRAFYIAKEGRPGPVLIDIPKDVTAAKADYHYQEPKSIPVYTEYIREKDIEEAINIINQSEKPFVYAGGGIIYGDATEELLQFVEKISAPVTCSLMGQGAFPATHKLYTGMIGMHGTKASNIAATECDLLIAIGARFSDRVVSKLEGFAPNAQVIHIDIDPAEINKNIKTHHYIIGDVKEVLKILNERLEKKTPNGWNQKIEEIMKEYPVAYPQDDTLRPQYIIEKIYEKTNGEAIITTEVGQHQMWTAQYYKFAKPRTLITSGGLGTMGYGTGAAMGAQLGMPEKQVVHIAGDGSFRMNCNELATITAYNIPLVIVVINNGTLGMVRQWQTMFYGGRYSATTLDRGPDFVKLAEAYGAKAYRITTKEELESALQEALSLRKPVLLDCHVDIDNKVLPMVPPGKAIEDVITEEEF
ncbi:MAG: biosynthetic-type acetolactate synthase large subunit [Epulopiscium sp.]|nr:biosynthetic-type acetolactate synthase large subunit [Candidatus Epulonipiscium sp.]